MRKILCPIDFSPTSKHALAAACQLAREHHAELVIAHAWQIPALYYDDLPFPVDVTQQMVDDAEVELGRAATEARASGVERTGTLLLTGSAWRTIVDALEADPAYDLVVIGANGRGGISRVLLGSVAERVVRHAPCSVLAVHASNAIGPYRNLLCPTDFSESADAALEVATSLVKDGSLTLLHVLDLPASYSGVPAMSEFVSDLDKRGAALMQTRVDAVRPKTNAQLHARTRIGAPGRQILAVLESEPAFDLVVMGSHGRTGARRLLLGSIAEKIVRHAPCPVVIARKRQS
jgi:nucleotide-binding universal stress UspA family protein